MAVFKPTGTSDKLIKAVKPYIKGGKLLDLACGSGVVGKALEGQVDEVYASDISHEAFSYVRELYPKWNVKCGNLFEPWGGFRFDYIVDDVSGVAEDIAKVSPWFEGVPCESGKDGAGLVVDMLLRAPSYLADGGKLFFPIVSLSNVDRILDVADRMFKIKLLNYTTFPLPKEMYEHKGLMEGLRDKGIQFEEKFGMILFYTNIYMGELR